MFDTNQKLESITLYLSILIASLILLLSFSSCTDTCKTTTTYTTYKPIYASMSELRLEVDILPPQPRESQGKIYVYGKYLLLGEPDKGIHVFNNADKTNPIAISFINIPGNKDMAVKGGKLYADSYLDLLVFDMSDANNISLANRVENVFSLYRNDFGIATSESMIVIGMEEIEEIEVSTDCSSESPGIINMEDVIAFSSNAQMGIKSSASGAAPAIGIGGSTARFTIVGNYLYTVDDYLMYVFDIISPENPVDINTVDLGWGIETIFPFKDNLFIGSQSGMFVYNIANPAQPEFMSGVQHITTCDPVVANEKYAFVTLRSENNNNRCGTALTNQLDVIDVSDVANARLLHTYTMTGPYGLGIDGNTLFVTEGDSGLKIFDITDVSKIDENLIHHIEGFNAFDVIPNNGTLILTGNDGLYQFDYTDLTEIKLLSLISATK